MDFQFDLTYNYDFDEFTTKDGDIFGYLIDSEFFYGFFSGENTLHSMFGDATDELLLNYLRRKFPNVEINGVETTDPESLI
jgi:hypothetical protein